MKQIISLNQLGWRNFFQQQLNLEELENAFQMRVFAVHKSQYILEGLQGQILLDKTHSMPEMTVGDWCLLDNTHHFLRTLEPFSHLARKAPGSKLDTQRIASNVDTMLIVSSLDDDFSLNRIERYLALAHQAGCQPVVVLTKVDLCASADEYQQQVLGLDAFLPVVAVNALTGEGIEVLSSYCATGQTLVLVGSSGVGKSSLLNALMGQEVQATGAVREDDSKGRHTTTARSVHCLPSGALVIDTPGVRELQLPGCEQGVEETFTDIAELANACRFADCQHLGEPKCAVQAAILAGRLEQRRLDSYHKLVNEQAVNALSLAQKRKGEKSFAKIVRQAQGLKHKQKDY